jgi:hypothetical protein
MIRSKLTFVAKRSEIKTLHDWEQAYQLAGLGVPSCRENAKRHGGSSLQGLVASEPDAPDLLKNSTAV